MEQNTKLPQKKNKCNVLLVEDTPTQAKNIKEHLGKKGHQVQHFSTGEACIKYLKNCQDTPDHQPIDIILMDMDLSKAGGRINGIETTLIIDQLHLYIPVMMMTEFTSVFRDQAGRNTTHNVCPKSALNDLDFMIENVLAMKSPKKIQISGHIIKISRIVCVETLENNLGIKICLISSKMDTEGEIYYTTKDYRENCTLKQFMVKIDNPSNFKHIHKKHIVNQDYLIACGKNNTFQFKGLEAEKQGARKRGLRAKSPQIQATEELKAYYKQLKVST